MGVSPLQVQYNPDNAIQPSAPNPSGTTGGGGFFSTVLHGLGSVLTGGNLFGAKDPTGKTFGSGGLLSDVGDVAGIPQNVVTGVLAGKNPLESIKSRFTPSQALGIKNPLLGFGTDLVLDPLNLAFGAGMIGKGAKLAGMGGKAAEVAGEVGKGAKIAGEVGKGANAVEDFSEGSKGYTVLRDFLDNLTTKTVVKGAENITDITPIATKSKYASSINLNLIPQEARPLVNGIIKQFPEILDRNGKLSLNLLNGLVKKMPASEALRMLAKAPNTTKRIAAVNTTRDLMSGISQALKEGGSQEETLQKLQEFARYVQIVDREAQSAGQMLWSFSRQANPSQVNVLEDMVRSLNKLGYAGKDIAKAFQNVNFNDFAQMSKAYRQVVKPGFRDLLTEFRYINLLSSPKTHIVNITSNVLQGSVMSPVTKLASGVIDLFGSKLTGAERTHYVSEVPAYYKGLANATGEAIKQALSRLMGKSMIERPDLTRIPSYGQSATKIGVPLAKFNQAMGFFPRLLEAEDIFFRTLITAGEKEALAVKYSKMGKTVDEAAVLKQAQNKASYYIFRQELDFTNKTGQGKVLTAIDNVTSVIYAAQQKIPTFRWIVPFVSTPMNIFKQMVEYSPLGLSTLWGNADKAEQLGKALTGSFAMLGAAWAVESGADSTWAAPINTAEKQAFFASGRQPYSIRIGHNWYDYSRLGPISFPLALVSSWKYRTEQETKALTRTEMENYSKILSDVGKYFSQQSYVEAVGEFINASQGDEAGFEKFLANYPQQTIPLAALVRWSDQIIDTIYRRPTSTIESVMSGIPGLSEALMPYTDQYGNPSVRQYPVGNALSPVKVTTTTDKQEKLYQGVQRQKGAGQIKQLQQTYRSDIKQINMNKGLSSEDRKRLTDNKTAEFKSRIQLFKQNFNKGPLM